MCLPNFLRNITVSIMHPGKVKDINLRSCFTAAKIHKRLQHRIAIRESPKRAIRSVGHLEAIKSLKKFYSFPIQKIKLFKLLKPSPGVSKV
jgi:hypothetical protein